MSAATFLLVMGCRQLVGIEARQVFDGAASGPVPTCGGLPIRGTGCAACMTGHCCAEAQQCAKDSLESLCSKTETCVQTCASGNSPCQLACSTQWNPVDDQQARLQDCRDTGCLDACGPWDCLGGVIWPVPEQIPAAITVRATAMCAACGPTGGTAANSGVHVRVCSIADPHCTAELTSADSDAGGKVKLTFNPLGAPASVFLELHKDGWLDDLLMLDTPPLSFDFDAGIVHMDTRQDVDQIAQDLNATPPAIYDPTLAVLKLRVGNCNLQRSTGVDLTWSNLGAATVDLLFNRSEWDAIVMNLPVPVTYTTRLVARKASAASPDGATEPFIASVNLVVRAGAITLAPFVTPTP